MDGRLAAAVAVAVRELTGDTGPAAERDDDAVTALEVLVALGSAALGPDRHRRLTALAEQDLRVRASGLGPGTAPAGERLREQAREAVREPT
ncbi:MULTISPECIES: hypothetical protein [unclassified Streptomyces]|uniref:hypothetical protein n=1 Tax=unclassified Streptomyces TaxID=2593676 RepID=UPI00380BE80F